MAQGPNRGRVVGLVAMFALALSALTLGQGRAFAFDHVTKFADLDCPSGMYLSGLRVRTGAWLDQIGILCTNFDPGVKAFGNTDAGSSPTEMYGGKYGDSGGYHEQTCPANMAAASVTESFTRDPDAYHVDNLIMVCQPATYSHYGDPYGYLVVNTDAGSSDGDIVGDLYNPPAGAQHAECGAFGQGYYAVGINGSLYQNSVALVGLDCRDIDIGSTSTPLKVAPPSPLDVLRSLASKGPSFTIAKTPVGPCTGPVNGNYLCPYTITVTNTGALNYSGPITFVDKSGYQHDPVTFGGISQFACSGTADPLMVKYAKSTHLLTCSANTIVPAGSSITATAVATISAGDAAMSACGNVANSVSLKAPVDIGPVWAHATLPGSSGCSPSAGTTDGVVPPECPFGWYRVHDQSRLPATWVRQQLTMNEISILCAKPPLASTINPSDIIKLAPLLSPCPPLMHRDPNDQCVPNPVILPNNTTPQARVQCRSGTVKIGRSCVPACPNGTVMPANGYCGPKIIPQASGQLPCGNQLRLVDGTCPKPTPQLLPQTPSSTINLHNVQKLLACPDGQLRLKNGQCPPPKTKINIKPFLLNGAQPGNGLH